MRPNDQRQAAVLPPGHAPVSQPNDGKPLTPLGEQGETRAPKPRPCGGYMIGGGFMLGSGN